MMALELNVRHTKGKDKSLDMIMKVIEGKSAV